MIRNFHQRRSVAGAAGVLLVALSGASMGLAAPGAPYTRPGVTELASSEPLSFSEKQALSADGRLVAFQSHDPALVPGGTNPGDIFVRDRATGAVQRISVSGSGAIADGFSREPAISADGRLVAFASYASNLVPGDTNERIDVFVHDRETGVTERVSVSSAGVQAEGTSRRPAISGDGRYVAFTSDAANLVPGDTNGTEDVFVHDRDTGQTERVSVGPGGSQAAGTSLQPAISADGRFVAFRGNAPNLDPRFATGTWQVFVHDRDTGQSELVSLAPDGTPASGSNTASPDISADGRFVAFDTTGANMAPAATSSTNRIYVRDRQEETTRQVSVSSTGEQTNGNSFVSAISADGRFVAFRSYGSNLVQPHSGQLDVYVHDRVAGTTERASVATDGALPDGMSFFPSLDADGRHVAFAADAITLAPGISTKRNRVYVRDRGPTLGAFDLAAQAEGDGIRISGAAAFSGVELARATADPTGPAAWGVSEASLTYRPESGDLLVRVGWVESLQRLVADSVYTTTSTPGETYGLAFEHGGDRWEARAMGMLTPAGALAATFALYRCTPICEEAGALAGGWGTTGDEVVVSVPLEAFGGDPGDPLAEVRAFSGPGESDLPAGRDWLDLPAVALPAAEVLVGVAPPGAGDDQVAFQAAGPVDGRFDLLVDAAHLPAGPATAWAKACLGQECRTSSVPVQGR